MPGTVRSVFVGGTTLRPIGLPGQGFATLDITLGSWVPDGNRTLQLWLTTSSWSQRFASSAPVNIEVINTDTGREYVSITGGPTDVTRVGASGPTLDITVVYVATTNVSMVPVVRNTNTSLKYLRSFEVLSSTSGVPTTAAVRLHLGGWADAAQGYYVDVTLLRVVGDWSSRFAKSGQHQFSISAAPGAAAGIMTMDTDPVVGEDGEVDDVILATESPDGSSGSTKSSTDDGFVTTLVLAVIAMLCISLVVGVATRWRYHRPATVVAPASSPDQRVAVIGECHV